MVHGRGVGHRGCGGHLLVGEIPRQGTDHGYRAVYVLYDGLHLVARVQDRGAATRGGVRIVEDLYLCVVRSVGVVRVSGGVSVPGVIVLVPVAGFLARVVTAAAFFIPLGAAVLRHVLISAAGDIPAVGRVHPVRWLIPLRYAQQAVVVILLP